MNLYTSRYGNRGLVIHPGLKVGISIGRPWLRPGYPVTYWQTVAPTRAMFRLPREEYEPLYIARLEALGIERVVQTLFCIGLAYFMVKKSESYDLILLCFEDLRQPGKWCHRRMLAAWLQERAGIEVPELEEG